LKKFINVYDLRENKNRYDDIVFTIDKMNFNNLHSEVNEIIYDICSEPLVDEAEDLEEPLVEEETDM
jgi:hypothetical protein